MSEEEIIAIVEKYAPNEPLSKDDAKKILEYCFKIKEKGCEACILMQRYGKGKKCPIVISVA